MTPRTLLVTGLGLLLLGLLLVLGFEYTASNFTRQWAIAQQYLATACSMVGAGLVVVAALLAGLRAREHQEHPLAHRG